MLLDRDGVDNLFIVYVLCVCISMSAVGLGIEEAAACHARG